MASAQRENGAGFALPLADPSRANSPAASVRLASDGGLTPLLPGASRVANSESVAERTNSAGLAAALPGSPHAGTGAGAQPVPDRELAAALPGSPHAVSAGSGAQPAPDRELAAALPGSPHAVSAGSAGRPAPNRALSVPLPGSPQAAGREANVRPAGDGGDARTLLDAAQSPVAGGGSSINHDAGESPAPQNENDVASWRQTATRWGPRIDGLASGLAVVQGAMVAARNGVSTRASNLVGFASGFAWTASAGASDASNSGWGWSRTSNFLGGAAGILNAAADLTTGETQANLAYSSSALWIGSALSNTVDTLRDTGHSFKSRALQLGANAANVIAASASAYAAKASYDDESGHTAVAGVIAPAAWFAGSVLTNLSAAHKPAPGTQQTTNSITAPLLSPRSEPHDERHYMTLAV